ncbi:hypothetical protein H6F73_03255 [Microcoleus sp. FACHB-68]|nr:hypothetical protein [Microcoleus sp. FACHB-68]
MRGDTHRRLRDQVTVVLPINQIFLTFAEVSPQSVCEWEGVGGAWVGCGIEAQRLREISPLQGVGMKCDPIRWIEWQF